MFWADKQAARAGRWRVSENVLLGLCFLGGWPGGLFASQLLRHKTSKVSFRVKFWCVVALQIGLVIWGVYYREDIPPRPAIEFAPSRGAFPPDITY